MQQTLINRIVEAALLAAPQPLTLVQLNGLFPLDEPAPDGSVQAALVALQQDCVERGVELVEVASGWRYQVKADVHPWVARLWTERQTKYTRATLETLALIAYRQPITRGEIEQIRGVAVNSNIIKALEEREWIRVVGHRDMPGKPELLGTTKAFLDYFGLQRLDELPPLSELKDFGDLEPQLDLDGAAIPAQAASAAAGADDARPDPDPTEGGHATETEHEDAASDRDADTDAGRATPEPAGDADTPPPEHASRSPSAHDPEPTALADDGDSTRSTP